MAQATDDFTTSRLVPLSVLFVDPTLRAAFRRAEDDGCGFAIDFAMLPDRPRCLDGGAAAVLDLECEEVL